MERKRLSKIFNIGVGADPYICPMGRVNVSLTGKSFALEAEKPGFQGEKSKPRRDFYKPHRELYKPCRDFYNSRRGFDFSP